MILILDRKKGLVSVPMIPAFLPCHFTTPFRVPSLVLSFIGFQTFLTVTVCVCVCTPNKVQLDTHIRIYSQFLFFVVVMFYKVAMYTTFYSYLIVIPNFQSRQDHTWGKINISKRARDENEKFTMELFQMRNSLSAQRQ